MMSAVKVLLIWSVALFIVPPAAMAQDKYIPKADEEIYGTWINAQLTRAPFQKMVIAAGKLKHYLRLSDSVPYDEATLQIVSRWTDSEGNVWYRTYGAYKGYNFQELDKLSDSGTVWEGEFMSLGFNGKYDPELFPKEFHPASSNHGISYRYRAEE